MPEFDQDQYHQFAAQAANSYRSGNYAQAIEVGRQAYELAPEGSSERAQAARNIGVSFYRDGNDRIATEWGVAAFKINNDLVGSQGEPPSLELMRERAVDAMYLSMYGLSAVIRARRDGQPGHIAQTAEYMRRAWEDMDYVEVMTGPDSPPDQYRINMASRASIERTLNGDLRAGSRLGWMAFRLAGVSESPRLPTSNHDLDLMARMKAKARAYQRASAALIANTLAVLPPLLTKRPMLYFAEKAL